jgi:hypothetical protein
MPCNRTHDGLSLNQIADLGFAKYQPSKLFILPEGSMLPIDDSCLTACWMTELAD